MSLIRTIILITFISFLSSCIGKKEKSKISSSTSVREVEQLPYFNSALFTPNWKSGTHKIPNFSFTNQKGELVTNKTFEGKIYIADFFFTICPGICPKLTKNMNILQEEYKNESDIMLLSHSVMPWYDTVDKLDAYAEKNTVLLPKWNLVTGNTDAIYKIAREGYFADEDFLKTHDMDEFIHTENFVLVDKKGYIRGVYNGTLELEVQRLMRHIEILKTEL